MAIIRRFPDDDDPIFSSAFVIHGSVQRGKKPTAAPEPPLEPSDSPELTDTESSEPLDLLEP